MSRLKKLEAKLGITFQDQSLLALALTPRIDRRSVLDNNEKLRFLGNGMINALVTEYIYLSASDHTDEEMVRFKDIMMDGERIATIALNMGLWEHLRLQDPGKTWSRAKTLKICFEAIVGAVYLDQGGEVCREFLGRHLFAPLTSLSVPPAKVVDTSSSPKHKLNQELFAAWKMHPGYSAAPTGTPKQPKFTVTVFAGPEKLGQGEGRSVKAAETAAARNALKNRIYAKKPAPDL